MKKILSLVFFSFLGLIIWFSFFKSYDHKISFQVDIPAGSMYDIISSSKTWEEIGKEQHITEKTVFKSIKQNMHINGKPFKLMWTFENRKDTNSTVEINFLNEEHSLKERYQSLFNTSGNLDTLIKISKNLKEKVNSFASAFRIEINGKDTLAEMQYLYVTQNTKRKRKAENMIKSNAQLFSKNRDRLVTKKGPPFNYVKKWDLESDSIQFRYAFPIEPKAVYPVDQTVKTDHLKKKSVLKATFYGNYRFSDQAWIALYHHAQRKNIEIELTPIEVFYNNPMFGGDDKSWKAEIFMLLKN